jgi:Putative zinc dependent peptidase (DUF5700)
MSRRSASLVAAFLLFCTVSVAAQEVEVDLSACRGMFEIVKAMHGDASRESVEQRLDALLEARPYRVMFAHYNRSWRPNHLPKDLFKRMILSLRFADAYKAGENERADRTRPHWVKYYGDLALFEKQLRQLESTPLPKLIDEGVRYAQSWLPPEWKIPGFYFPVIPNGGSPAFTIEGSQGYDFFQLPDIQRLVGTIAHESHHLGVQTKEPESLTPAEMIAFRVLTLAVAEGTATKFVSGAPPGCVPAIAGAPYNIFTPELTQSWKALVADEAELVKHQATLLDRALAGDLSEEAFNADLRDYWLSGAVGRAYVIGAEMFGAINLAFGKDAVFTAMRDPRRLFSLYNAALDAKPQALARCVRVPEAAARKALAIGTSASSGE